MEGVEPSSLALQARVLPLDDTPTWRRREPPRFVRRVGSSTFLRKKEPGASSYFDSTRMYPRSATRRVKPVQFPFGHDPLGQGRATSGE